MMLSIYKNFVAQTAKSAEKMQKNGNRKLRKVNKPTKVSYMQILSSETRFVDPILIV